MGNLSNYYAKTGKQNPYATTSSDTSGGTSQSGGFLRQYQEKNNLATPFEVVKTKPITPVKIVQAPKPVDNIQNRVTSNASWVGGQVNQNVLQPIANTVKKIGNFTAKLVNPQSTMLKDAGIDTAKIETLKLKPNQKKLAPEQLQKVSGASSSMKPQSKEESIKKAREIQAITAKKIQDLEKAFEAKKVAPKKLPKGYKEPGILGDMVDALKEGVVSTMGSIGAGFEMTGRQTVANPYRIDSIAAKFLTTHIGKRISDEADNILASNPEWQADPKAKLLLENGVPNPKTIARLGVGAAPSILINIAATLVTAPVGGWGGLVTGYMMEGGSTYKEAKKMGVPEDKAQFYGTTVGIVNSIFEHLMPTSSAGLGLFKKGAKEVGKESVEEVSKSVAKEALKQAKKFGINILKNGAIEGGTEGIQEFWSNVIATNYDKNRKVWDNIIESMVGGFVGGGVAGGSTESAIDNNIIVIPDGEHTPQAVIGQVIANKQENTVEGKELLKTAVEAQQKGQNVLIETTKKGEVNSEVQTINQEEKAAAPKVEYTDGAIKKIQAEMDTILGVDPNMKAFKLKQRQWGENYLITQQAADAGDAQAIADIDKLVALQSQLEDMRDARQRQLKSKKTKKSAKEYVESKVKERSVKFRTATEEKQNINEQSGILKQLLEKDEVTNRLFHDQKSVDPIEDFAEMEYIVRKIEKGNVTMQDINSGFRILEKNGYTPGLVRAMITGDDYEMTKAKKKAEEYVKDKKPKFREEAAQEQKFKVPTLEEIKAKNAKDKAAMEQSGQKSAEDMGEEKMGWKDGQKDAFDNAVSRKDTATVKEMLKDVPEYYKTEFKTQIDEALSPARQYIAEKIENRSVKFRLNDDVLYHGAAKDLGDNPTLKRGYGLGEAGKYTGSDMGGIFFTPSIKYALQYSGEGENSLYKYSLPKGTKIFDINDQKALKQFVENSKNWKDYDDPANARKDAERMIQDMKETASYGAIDWATGSQYADNIEQSGFDAAKFLERPGENIQSLPDGTTSISGKPVYSIALFGDEVTAKVERAFKKVNNDLITIHNLSDTGVLKALKMGGLPAPSLAITKANIPFTGFGEISLIGDKRFTLDDIYTSDVYSKRVPKQQFKINETEKQKALKDLDKYFNKTGESKYGGIHSALAEEGRASMKELIYQADYRNTLKAMYLEEVKGIDIGENKVNRDIAQDIKNGYLGVDKRALSASKIMKDIVQNKDINAVTTFEDNDTGEVIDSKYIQAKKLVDSLIEDSRAGLLEEYKNAGMTEMEAKKVSDDVIKNLQETFYVDDRLNNNALYDLQYRLREYLSKGLAKVDESKVENIINDKFKDVNKKEYHAWVKERFDNVYGRSYFEDNAGRAKNYSLENIFEFMVGRVRGQENFWYGAGSIKSRISKKLRGPDEVISHKELIQSEKVTKEIHDKMWDRTGDLIERIKSESEWKNSDGLGIFDQIGKDIASIGTSITKARVKSVLRRAGVADPTQDLIDDTYSYLIDLRDSPVAYFEAKPQRIVKVGEFVGALVPQGTDKELVTKLEQEGLKVVEYDIKSETSRAEAINREFSEAKFRVRDDVKKMTGRTITDAQEQELIDLNQKFFGDDKVNITLQIMANSKALGKYQENMIEILDGQADPKATYLHEAVHKYLDVFSTTEEYVDVLEEGSKKYKTEDFAEVEEKIAEDFITYAKTKETSTAGIKGFFSKIIARIKLYFGNKSAIDRLYNEIIEGTAAKVNKSIDKAVSSDKSAIPTNEQAQTPVGEGDKTKSKAYTRVYDRLAEEAQQDVSYNKLNLEKDTQNALDFITTDPKAAIRVGLGLEEVPAGQTETAVSIALADKAGRDGDYWLQSRLESSRSLRQTRRGQEIVAERGRFNEDSPHFFIREVMDRRLHNLGSNLKSSLEELQGKAQSAKKAAIEKIDKGVSKLKEKIKADRKKITLAQDIIDSIIC